ncbi:MAG: DNA polymerase I [Planctomycetota bacterium]
MAEKKVFLIDGNSQAYQAYYAIRTGLSAPDGLPTNAVFGFTSMLQKIIREKRPDYLAVAFDTAAPTFRHEAYSEYKAQRKPMPEDLIEQLGYIRKVLDGYRIPVFAVDGYEGDDVLGTLAVAAAEKGLTAVIVTRDKDALQLLHENVVIWDNRKDAYITVETLREEKDIEPEQVVEMMALSGDTSDNVPGIPGIGPKTALSLIRKYGTLDNVLAHVEEIRGKKTQQNIREHADDARMSKELVTIDTNVPLEIDFEALRIEEPDREQLSALFRRLDFRKMLADLAETADDTRAEYILVNDEKGFKRLLNVLEGAETFAFDVETTGISPIDSELVGISFAVAEDRGWYVSVLAPEGEKTLDKARVIEAVKPLLEDGERGKTGQNLKYDIVAMRREGVRVEGVAFDTMVAAYVIDPGRRRYSLSDLAADYLNYRMTPISDLIGKGKKQITLAEVEQDRVARYSGEDAQISLKLTGILGAKLTEMSLERLFYELEVPLVEVLADMEADGVLIDADYLGGMSGELEGEIAAVERRIHEEAGKEFNIASTRQLAQVLFEERGLRPGRRTKTGLSTDNEVLERLSTDDPIARDVLEYRSLAKLKNTYLDALPRMISERTGRVHASFNQTGTATGRLSSSDPNLQNIPVRTPVGRRIRKAFITEPGLKLLAADYSQIELRIAAHFSGDKTLQAAFHEGKDIHNFVAREIYGVGEDEVTSEMRRMAKAVNFGIIYGQSPYGLSRQLGIPVGEAAEFIDNYFGRYPGVERYIQTTLEQAAKDGYVTTILGRRRYIGGIEAKSPRNLNSAERMAVNTTIQGSAADLIKLAMLAIHRRHRRTNSRARMILQIHDELVLEVPSGEAAGEAEALRKDMVGALALSVPIVVNVSTGDNWLEAGG